MNREYRERVASGYYDGEDRLVPVPRFLRCEGVGDDEWQVGGDTFEHHFTGLDRVERDLPPVFGTTS